MSDTECKCGCGLDITDDMARVYGQIKSYVKQFANYDLFVTSGARCAKYNSQVGGEKYSAHILGKAIDIAIPDNKYRFAVLKALLYYGITRIGIGKTFTHFDIASGKYNDKDSYVQNDTWLYA